MSSKTTRKNQQARMRLAEARAKSLRDALDRIMTILHPNRMEALPPEESEEILRRVRDIADIAVAQDEQRVAPERLRQNLKDLRTAIKQAAEKEADEE